MTMQIFNVVVYAIMFFLSFTRASMKEMFLSSEETEKSEVLITKGEGVMRLISIYRPR